MNIHTCRLYYTHNTDVPVCYIISHWSWEVLIPLTCRVWRQTSFKTHRCLKRISKLSHTHFYGCECMQTYSYTMQHWLPLQHKSQTLSVELHKIQKRHLSPGFNFVWQRYENTWWSQLFGRANGTAIIKAGFINCCLICSCSLRRESLNQCIQLFSELARALWTCSRCMPPPPPGSSHTHPLT